MNKYSDFIEKLGLPSEEEFNKLIEQLPPYEELSNYFEFDPQCDNLQEKLFEFGFLGDKEYNYCYVDSLDLEKKEVYVGDINSLEQLNKIYDKLIAAGWTLGNYEEDVKYFEEKFDAKKQELLIELGEIATLDQLKEFIENVNKK